MADFCGLRRTGFLWQKRPRRAVLFSYLADKPNKVGCGDSQPPRVKLPGRADIVAHTKGPAVGATLRLSAVSLQRGAAKARWIGIRAPALWAYRYAVCRAGRAPA